MTIASLIVDVAANTVKLQQDVEKIGRSFDSLSGVATKMAGALGIAFTIKGAVDFGRTLLNDADALVKMSDRTGMSIAGLQRLQVAGDDAGDTIDQMSNAVNKFQDKLAGGDKSAVAAMKTLGLNLDAIRLMEPDQQFMAISDALRGIDDPARQVNLAIDLFGKTGAEVLPVLKRGFDDVRMSVVGMSEATVIELDKAGDTLGAWWRVGKGVFAEAIVTIAHYGVLLGRTMQGQEWQMAIEQQQAERAELKKLNVEIDAFVSKVAKATHLAADDRAFKLPMPTPLEIREFDRNVDDLIEKQAKAREAAKRAADEHKRFADSVTNLTSSAIGAREAFGAYGQLMPDMSFRTNELTNELQGLTADGLIPATDTIEKFNRHLLSLGDIGQGPSKALAATQVHLKSFGDFMTKDLGGMIMGAFQGGGNVAQTIGSGVGGFLASASSGVGKSISDSITNIFGKSIGGVLNTFLPGIGSLVGGLIGKGIGALGKAFGIDKEAEKVNDLRDAFQKTFGTFDDMHRAAVRAGYSIEKLLDAHKAKDFNEEMQKFKEAIAFQDEAMRTLDETTKKYGFTLEELGPALQRQNLDQQAQELFKDWSVLNAAQIDNVAISNRMSESVNAYLHNVLAVGAEVPIAMKPMLERMVQLGLLTDAAGNTITDLGESGVSFAMTMSEGFKSLITEVQKLTEAIARGLGIALDTVATQAQNMPPVDVEVRYHVPDLPYVDMPTPDVYPMADGGIGRVTKPTLFLAGEAGAEDVAFSGGGRRFGGGGGSSDVSGLLEELKMQRDELRRALLDLPKAIKRAA